MSLKNKLNRVLRKFNVELHGTGYLQALGKGEFNNDEMEIFKKVFSSQNITIYDVGANRGLMIKNFMNCFPQSSIHAFEPYQPFYENLVKEYEHKENIVINKHGISNEETEMIFNVNRSIDTSSFLPSKKTGLNSDKQVETIEQVKVPVITIDAYAAKHSHKKINILKLDIQGSELNALKGAEGLIKEKRIDMIYCETYFVKQYENQPLFFDTANYLLKNDYVLQDIYHPVYGLGKIAWCDSMFVRNDLKMI